MKKPYIIALEGIPGSGKTTLRDSLTLDGLIIERVEQILPGDPQSDDHLGQAEIIASDFLKTERIKNSNTDLIILDRYFLSTLAYQYAFDRLHDQYIDTGLVTLYEKALKDGRLVLPDITFYIDTPQKDSFERKKRQPGEELWVNSTFLKYIQEYYSDQENLYWIDGRRPLDSIQSEIQNVIIDKRNNG